MKKLYPLFCFILFSACVQAQVTANTYPTLNYDSLDKQLSIDNFTDYSRYVWELNSRYSNADNSTLRYVAVEFDSLLFLDGNNARAYYPKSSATVTLDSFAVLFIHEHHTANPDSIRFTVYNTSAAIVTGAGTPSATFTTPPLWDTLIIANASIPLNTSNYTTMICAPGVTLPHGQSVGIRVDFAGDTANKFSIVAGFRDDCAGSCQAEISAAGNNSAYYLNLIQNGTPPTNFSGYYENNGNSPAIFYDCDQSGGYTVGACESFPIQNINITAFVTAVVDFGVTIVPNAGTGCPGASVTLAANAYGSAATPFTYSWATSSGTLTTTTDPEVALILAGTNATVNVTVTDANNATVTNSITIVNKGISMIITNANPLTINCGGGNTTLTTTISGVTTGKNYTWSTGATGATQSTIQISSAGTYSVTVTNSAGCSASADIAVQYPGNLTNTASFILPNAPRCEDAPLTFINTSLRLNGWTPQWTFGDGNIGFNINGTNTYANPGVYSVSLQIDSAGCVFQSPSSNITVLPASNALCLNTGLSVTLGSDQSVCNDSYVTLNAFVTNGAAPYTFNWSSTGNALSCNTCANPSATITQNSTYTVTVIDINNESATAVVSYTVTGGTNAMQVSATNTAIDCTHPLNSTVVTVTGGASPYTFNWGNASSNSGTSPQTHNYSLPGQYVIAVTDAAGCVSSILDTVEYFGIVVTATQLVHPVCEYNFTGKIKVSSTGGSGPYTYFWSDNSTADSIVNVRAGNYTVTVTDVTSCSATALFPLSPTDGWGYSVFITATNSNCSNNGALTSTVTGGTLPYNYNWNTTPPQTTANAVGLGSGTYTLTVTDGLGCTTMGQNHVYANCVSIISGMVFVDTNNNCLYNAGEAPSPGFYVVAQATNGAQYYGCTGSNGRYTISVPTNGTFTLLAINYFGAYNTCGNLSLCGATNQTITIVTPGDSSSNNNFAFTGNSGFDLNIHPGWTSGNPGFDKDYWIYCGNQAQAPFNGQATVTFKYDSNLIYQSSNPPASHDLLTHTLTWMVDTFVTGAGFWDHRLWSYFMVPQNLSLGYLLQSDFRMTPTVGDCDSSNNALHVQEIVTGSRDPNEKDVEPAGRILETDSMLTYTIHFQNNGTDSTHFIIVYDTLSNSLDPATVRNLASSHPYSDFTIMGEGILKWTFNPLRLVDSITNPEGSKGFIRFSVKKRHNLPIGSVISNKAHIYFDYNEPVVTNTVQDTMSLPNYIFEARGTDGISVRAYPNPFNDVTSIVVDGLNTKFDFELYDLTGSLHKRITSIETSKFELQRDALSSGVYFYRIVTGAGKGAYGKLVVQ